MMSREQRTSKRKLCNFLLCPAANTTCICLQPFFFPPVQRHTPFSLQIPFCNLCIGSCLFPSPLGPPSTNYFFSLYPSHSSDSSLSVEVSSGQRQETSLDPHHSCSHLASDGLSKRDIYFLNSCFAPLPTDNPTSILPRKFIKQKTLKH